MGSEGLCELHRHLLGALPPQALPRLAALHAVDWAPYQRAYHQAYGHAPDIRGLLRRSRDGDPAADDELHRLLTFHQSDGPGFERFQAKHDAFTWACPFADPALRRRPTAAADAAVDLLLDEAAAACEREGIAHCELRVLLPAGLREPVARWLWTRLAEGCRQRSGAGRSLAILAGLPRSDAARAWGAVAAVAQTPAGAGLVGIDLCHREEGHPPAEWAAVAHEIQTFNRRHPERALALCVHVGESYGDKSLESATRWVAEAAQLGAHRLGHALALGIAPAHHGPQVRHELVGERRTHLAWLLDRRSNLEGCGYTVDEDATRCELAALAQQDPQRRLHIAYDDAALARWARFQTACMAMVRDSGAVIESCPSSNQRIAGITDPRHHPLHRFLAANLPVVIGSDDPGLLAVDLPGELALASDWVGDPTAPGRWQAQAWAARAVCLSGRATGAA